MKKHYTLAFLLLLGTWLYGQQAISSSGNQSSNSTAKASWTIGQPFSKTIGNSNHNLTQGVLQPIIEVNSVYEEITHDFNIEAYPNPTTQYVELYVSNIDGKNLKYELFNLSGKKLISKSILTPTDRIATEDLSPSTYILKVYEDQNYLQSFKIIKK